MGGVFTAIDRALGTDITGSKATDAAISAQARGTSEAEKFLNPYSEAGLSALAGLQKPNIDLMSDPSYQFRLSEGMKALNAAASARGLANSGRTLKELTRYGQDYASTEYQNAYNREMGRLGTIANMGFGAAQGMAGLKTGMGQAEAAAQVGQANRMSDLTGQIIQGGAAALFSDQNLKENIRQIDTKDLAEMKSFLKAYAFNYKNAEHGQDEWIGVMAQDLEKSKLGKTLVFENAKGEKQINVNKVLSLFLATMAEA